MGLSTLFITVSTIRGDNIVSCPLNIDCIQAYPPAHSDDKRIKTRIDLNQLFSTSGKIYTAGAGGGSHSSKAFKEAQSALFVTETPEEITALIQKAKEEHIELLKKHRVTIM